MAQLNSFYGMPFGMHALDLLYHEHDAPSFSLATLVIQRTRPKTVCLLSSQGVGTVVMKNWDPLVPGPELAMESVKGRSCRRLRLSSSANGSPQMLTPPVPSPVQQHQRVTIDRHCVEVRIKSGSYRGGRPSGS